MPSITLFENLTNPRGQSANIDWDGWFNHLETPIEIDDKFAAPGWSPAIFNECTRSKETVKTVAALGLDFDEGVTIEAAHEFFSVYQGSLHTTFSHTDEHPRFRVVLPFNRPVTADEYARVWETIYDRIKRAGMTLDRGCKDASRFWFLPAVKPGGQYIFQVFRGNLLDVDEVLKTAELRAELRKKKVEQFTPRGGSRAQFDAAIARIASLREGSRNTTINAIVYHEIAPMVMQRVVSEDAAATLILQAAEAAGLTESEIKDTMQRALRDGIQAAEINLAQNGGFDIISAGEIFKPVLEPKYIADGVIREGSVTLLGAYGGSGKTWLAISLMVQVSIGGRWLERFSCEQGRTLFLDWESGSYELRRRIQKYCSGLNRETVTNDVELCCMPNAYMTSPDFEFRVRQLAEGRKLIVIDSLKAASPNVEENSADMRGSLDILRRVAEHTGCAFLVLVHAKKTSEKFAQDSRQILRGSSAIYDAADTVFTMALSKDKKVRIDHVKSRQGKSIEPFLVAIQDTEDGQSVLVTAEDLDPVDLAPDPLEAACETIVRVLALHPGETMHELALRSSLSIRAASAGIDKLIERGEVYSQAADGKIALYLGYPAKAVSPVSETLRIDNDAEVAA